MTDHTDNPHATVVNRLLTPEETAMLSDPLHVYLPLHLSERRMDLRIALITWFGNAYEPRYVGNPDYYNAEDIETLLDLIERTLGNPESD